MSTEVKPYLSFGGMCWPNPRYMGSLCWHVAHSPTAITRSDQLVLSSFAQAYEHLIAMPVKERNRRIASIKREMRASGGPAERQDK